MFAFAISLVLAIASAASACDLSIDPADFATARLTVRDMLRSKGGALSQDFVVCLGPGVIDASTQPLVFSEEDSPSSGRIIWRGAETVVSGGVGVTGWKAAGAPGVYIAPVPSSYPSGAAVRQLWIGNTRASRNIITDVSTVSEGRGCWAC
jgi:hypothetical protein